MSRPEDESRKVYYQRMKKENRKKILQKWKCFWHA